MPFVFAQASPGGRRRSQALTRGRERPGGHGNDIELGGPGNDVLWVGAGADVQYGGQGNDVLHALANDNQRDVLACGAGFDVAYVIRHDPVTVHGCEQVIRLSPDEAASMAAANDDNN